MSKNRLALAMAMAFPFAVPAFAQSAAQPAAGGTPSAAAAPPSGANADGTPIKVVGVVTVIGGQPTSLPTHVNGYAYMGVSKFFTTDIRVRYAMDRQWSLAFGIDNLNDYKYWDFHPYPQRSYVAELKFDM